MRKFCFLMVPALLFGCTADTSDLEAFVLSVQQTTSIPIEPYPELATTPVFKYSVAELRSPFILSDGLESLESANDSLNCDKPDLQRAKMPLENFGIDALEIKGFFTSFGRSWALISANDGSLHKATVGDRLGLFFGEIVNISDKTITYIEKLPDGTGCWQAKSSTLSMSAPQEANDNV